MKWCSVTTGKQDEELNEKLVLDGIVTVVDSKHIEQHLDDKKPEGVENEVALFELQNIAFPQV